MKTEKRNDEDEMYGLCVNYFRMGELSSPDVTAVYGDNKVA